MLEDTIRHSNYYEILNISNCTIIKVVKIFNQLYYSTLTNTIYPSTILYWYYALSRPTYSKLTISFKFSNYNLRFLSCPYMWLRSPFRPSFTFNTNIASLRIQINEFPYYVNRRISTVSRDHSFVHSFSILSDDRSKASSKTMPPHSAIQSLLFQMRVSSPVLKVIQ